LIYYLLTLVIVIFTSVAHLLLKKGSVVSADNYVKMYLHPYSITAYIIFAIVAFLSIYAMKGLDLKVFFGLSSLTYMCIPVLSFMFLKDSVTKNKLIGIIMISIGVIIFNF
jgi:drug/metabolite transporter (DMT)-like permease